MGKVFSISNQKGGVGKTTTAVNIATFCALNGVKTLMIDSDPQGNSTSGIGVDRNNLKSTTYEIIVNNENPKDAIIASTIENLYIIPANPTLAAAEIELIGVSEREFILKKAIQPIKNDFDFIIIDCPPSLGLLTINALTASEQLIIPLQCEYYALEGLGQLLNTFKLVKENLNSGIEIGGVVLTMADFRTNLTQQVIEEVRSYFGDKTFKTIVPRSVKVSEAPSFGKPIILYDPSSKGAKAYKDVGAEFLEKFYSKIGESSQVATPNQSPETHFSEQVDQTTHTAEV